MRLLLPYLLAGFGPDITADYRAASLMILTQLGTQATLSDTLVTGRQQASCGLSTRPGLVVWFMLMCAPVLTVAMLMMSHHVGYQSLVAL